VFGALLKNNSTLFGRLNAGAIIFFAKSHAGNIDVLWNAKVVEPILDFPIQFESWGSTNIFDHDRVRDWLSNNVFDLAVVPNSGCGYPCSIGVNVGIIGVVNAAFDQDEAKYGHESSAAGYIVQRPHGTYLSILERLFAGAAYFLIGGWIGGRGLIYGPFYLWLIGWSAGISGALFFLLPLLTEKIPTP
jgi:hypothetical protein